MEHRGLPSREGCLHAVLEQEIARARLGASLAPSSELRRLPVAKGLDEIPNRIKSVQLVSLECLSRHIPGSRKGGCVLPSPSVLMASSLHLLAKNQDRA